MALRSIASKFLLDGEQSPLGPPKGGHPKAIQQLLEGYRREDPPSQPKLAVPLTVPRHIAQQGARSTSPRTKAIGDLALIAFYYLLRVGEYTYHRPSDRRRTQHFRVHDVAFWHNTTLLPHDLPVEVLSAKCTSATLSISNQKNGRRNQSIHQERVACTHCPILALIRRVKHIQSHTSDPSTCIGTYFSSRAHKGRIVGPTDINTAVKQAVTDLGLARNGLLASHVGSHSLRAGGAMAMHLNHISHDTIKKMGRWSSDTFLMYIHEQIAVFSKNVSTKMSRPLEFHNIQFQRIPAPTVYSHAPVA